MAVDLPAPYHSTCLQNRRRPKTRTGAPMVTGRSRDTAGRPVQDGFALAHTQEMSTTAPPPNSITASIQNMSWCPVSPATVEAHGVPASETQVAMWSAAPDESGTSKTTSLVHISRCQLEVTSLPDLSPRGGSLAGKIERVALHGNLFRSLLSQTALPDTTTTVPRHFDDDDEWVFSRCVLAEFSGLGEEEAARASLDGELCCWASLVAMRDHGQRAWDIGVVVHRVFKHQRSGSRPASVCGCYRG